MNIIIIYTGFEYDKHCVIVIVSITFYLGFPENQ